MMKTALCILLMLAVLQVGDYIDIAIWYLASSAMAYFLADS